MSCILHIYLPKQYEIKDKNRINVAVFIIYWILLHTYIFIIYAIFRVFGIYITKTEVLIIGMWYFESHFLFLSIDYIQRLAGFIWNHPIILTTYIFNYGFLANCQYRLVHVNKSHIIVQNSSKCKKMDYKRILNLPITTSIWFLKFLLGCHRNYVYLQRYVPIKLSKKLYQNTN